MRPSGCALELAERRIEAVERVLSGETIKHVANRTGVTARAVRDWLHTYRISGAEGLGPKPRPHPKRRITDAQLQHIKDLMKDPPHVYGLNGQIWYLDEIVSLIEQQYGVKYHPNHLTRLGLNTWN